MPTSAPSRRLLAHASTAALLAAMSSLGQAADLYKTNSELATLVTAAAWVNVDNTPIDPLIPANGTSGSTNPATSTTDVWIWDNRVNGTDLLDGVQNLSVGNDTGVRKILIKDPAVPIVINGSGTRTITMTSVSTSTDPLFLDSGYGGIDMSEATQDLTIENLNPGSNVGLRLGAGSQTFVFNVAANRTLTINSPVAMRSGASNGIVKFTGAGRTVISGEFKPSHAIINAGEVEFSRPNGSSRIATASPNPPSYTLINGGTVWVTNTSGSATGASAVTVNDTATFGGAGIITGALTANSGATLTPGRGGVGTLGIGSLTLNTGSKIIFEANNSADADLLNVTANNGLTIQGGTIYLYNPGTTTPLSATGTFNLINCVGAVGGAGFSALTIAEETKIEGRNYTLGLGAFGITLTITSGEIIQRSWDVDASGSWSTAANWSADTVPDAIGTVANITGPAGAIFSAPRTITVDSARTVGTLVLDSAQPTTLVGTAELTFNNDGAAATLDSSGANHLISSPLALTVGGLLAEVDASTTLTLTGAISGPGVGLVKSGAGTLLLTADNTYTGATSVASGTLLIGSGGATGSVAGPIASSGLVRFNRTGSTTLSSAISGSGAVEFAGSGTTTLSVANTHTGATTITGGSLTIAHAQALQNASLTYSSTGGTLTVADPVTTLTLGSLAGDRGLPLTNSIGTALALTVGGNGTSTSYSGSPIGTGLTFTKTGSGTLALSGTHVYSGFVDPLTSVATGTTVNAGILSLDTGANFTTTLANVSGAGSARILVNGGTLTASAASLISNVTSGLVVASGTANFNAGLANETGSSSGNPFISVTGGTLNASSITLSRGGLSITSRPANGQTANGLYVNGGTVNVTGALGIGSISGSNSSVSARIDSGTVNVGGPLTVGINNTGRWSVLDVNGGALNVTDTTSGLLLGSGFAGQVIMFVRNTNAVVTTPRIQFGQAALGGKAFLNLSAGALYIGSGGLVLGSSAPTGTDVVAGQFEASLALDGGTLGATADWSSPIPMTMNGDISITAANASNVPHTITLTGPAIGLGVLTKNGAGTALLTSTASDITGGATVNAGTLALGGKVGQLIVNAGATFAPQGVLKSDFATTLDGTLAIGYNSINTPSVNRIESDSGGITLGTGSSLTVSGTGNLASGTYVILKASGGITGTFSTTTLPAGLTLNYNYDDDSNPETPAAVALVGSVTGSSPYELWTTSFSLTGNDALVSADPDADGLINQLEYALQTSPVASTSSPYTVARSGNVLTLSFNHPADASLAYVVEATNDLATAWTTVHTFSPFTTAGSALYTDTADLTSTPKRFLRLKVTPVAP